MKRWGVLLFLLLAFSSGAQAFKSFEAAGGAIHHGILQEALGAEVTPQVLQILSDACNTQDIVESHNFGDATHHFDNNELKGSRQYMQERFRQAAFFAARCNKDLAMRDGALREMGLLLHTAQDFYSHSNYIELQLRDLVRVEDLQPVKWTAMPAGIRTGYFFYSNAANSELNRSRTGCIHGLHGEYPSTIFAGDNTVWTVGGFPRTYEGALALATGGPELIHHDLNKDGPSELQGSVVHPASGLTLHEIARRTAVRETKRIWAELRQEITKKHGKQAPVLIAVLSGKQLPGAVPLPELDAPLEITLHGPKELASGQQAMFTVSTRGNLGTLRYRWTTNWGRGGEQDFLHETFVSPATYTISVQVTDEGRPGEPPAEAQTNLVVLPPLTGTVQGPDRAEPDQGVTFEAQVQGGRPPYTYRWSSETQALGESSTLSGQIRGQSGQERRVQVEVRDSMTPPQVLTLEKRVLLMAPPEIVVESVTVEPATLAPGGRARVTVRFQPRNFGQDPVVTARVRVWLEMTPGSGQGLDHVFEVPVPQGHFASYWGEFILPDPCPPGALRAEGAVTVGGLTRVGTAVAQVPRPGGLQDVTVDSRTVQLEIWDHGTIDGDVVTLTLNGAPLLSGATLADRPYRMTVQLRPGPNRLEVFAHNEGSSSPNTAALKLSNVIQGPGQQQYSLTTNSTGYFDIVAP